MVAKNSAALVEDLAAPGEWLIEAVYVGCFLSVTASADLVERTLA